MAVKLDMSKAYDRAEWSFVEEVMKKMGFDSEWVTILLRCVTLVSYSVVINNHIGESFYPTRGLRQGDPLSPFLFLFCGEGLSSLMKLGMMENRVRGVKASKSRPPVSHLLFADDCLLFGEATERSSIYLKQILHNYEVCSGQKVNFSKSTIFFSSNSQEEERRTITRVLGVRRSDNMERYLGLPNLVGRRKKEAFQILKDKFKQRIENWSIKYLSQGGKEIFIKAILQSIPTYAMSCFLLPKSLCNELEGIIAKYWWQKNKRKKGIHWCAWKDVCLQKESGGLGFRSFNKFNVALLAKQGWRLFNYPSYLLARVLKAKYFPKTNFLNASLGNLPSLTWRSIWASKKLLLDGLCWRVGIGNSISIWNDRWIPGVTEDNLQNNSRNDGIRLVSDLINEGSKTWNRDLIVNTFTMDIAKKIMQIPLSKSSQADFQVWRGEATGIFSVRSTYKLLQESTIDPNAYLQTHIKKIFRKLWNLNLPSKIKITVWKIAWNYIPTFSNLKLRRIMTEDRCLKCGQEAEDSEHVFQRCPIVEEVWSQLNFSWILNNSHLDLWSWLTWVFSEGTNEQCRSFCCGLWIIWTSRNKFLYEGKISTNWELSKQIKSYILDLDGIKERELTLVTSTRSSQRLQRANTAIFFNAAFDFQNNRSASGLVVKEPEGRIVVAKSILYENVASPFTAEAYAGFLFIPRTGNIEAHRLAKETLTKGEEQYLEGETLRVFYEEQDPTRLVYSEQRERR
ncbi:uncharacterized protein LOC105772073 [Gossypium raimondii]|uniref:uncharacterized protein LOC105772073 n=1 Tax=Gossypium raimondii TaxID=29730 RepID=UPI00227AB600|nr:uncharacterized protein LOC105772073 [Gossypium raimondii]